jgi:GT2 family glycosyltransferase
VTPVIAVILLNYNAADKTCCALRSLESLDYPNLEVFVIDNASGDGSTQTLRAFETTLESLTIVENPDNFGYSGGHNPLLKLLLNDRPDIEAFWLLNNDTTVDSKALLELVGQWQAHPTSIIGSVLRYPLPNSRFQRVGNRLNFWKTKLVDYRESDVQEGEDLESVSGASWLLSRQALQELGLLDERYFLYFEDSAYCFQARQAGWTCRVALNSIVYHEESATTSRYPALMAYYYQRNRLLFLSEHLSKDAFSWVKLYTQWRLKRDARKYPELKQAFHLAYEDFKAGRFGRCTHSVLY